MAGMMPRGVFSAEECGGSGWNVIAVLFLTKSLEYTGQRCYSCRGFCGPFQGFNELQDGLTDQDACDCAFLSWGV